MIAKLQFTYVFLAQHQSSIEGRMLDNQSVPQDPPARTTPAERSTQSTDSNLSLTHNASLLVQGWRPQRLGMQTMLF